MATLAAWGGSQARDRTHAMVAKPLQWQHRILNWLSHRITSPKTILSYNRKDFRSPPLVVGSEVGTYWNEIWWFSLCHFHTPGGAISTTRMCHFHTQEVPFLYPGGTISIPRRCHFHTQGGPFLYPGGAISVPRRCLGLMELQGYASPVPSPSSLSCLLLLLLPLYRQALHPQQHHDQSSNQLYETEMIIPTFQMRQLRHREFT